MDGTAPARAHDHDRLRLPSIPAPQTGEAGKEESRDHRLSPPCQRSGQPSSPLSNGRPKTDVRIAAAGSVLGICQSSARSCGERTVTFCGTPKLSQLQMRGAGNPVFQIQLRAVQQNLLLSSLLDPNDASRVKAAIFSIAVQIWIACLVCENARPPNPIIVRSVIVTVDPELRLKLGDDVAQV